MITTLYSDDITYEIIILIARVNELRTDMDYDNNAWLE